MENPATLSENEVKLAKLVIKACDACRKKKIRCDIVENSCRHCLKYRAKCVFTPIKVNKGPRRPPGYKHVEKLEERLKNMEALLQGQSWVRVEGENEHRLGDAVEKVNGKHGLPIPPESGPTQGARQSKRPKTSIHEVSGSLPSAENPSLSTRSQVVAIIQPSSLYWELTASSPIFSRREFIPLPSKSDAQLLLQDTFQSFNSAFPIFDPVDFQNTFESRYGNSKDRDDPSWWACLNVIFAFAHRFRAMRSRDSESEEYHAWGYLQNALATVSEITVLSPPNLMSVQALLGMTILLQGTPNPESCSVLIFTAIKLSQSMKLHDHDHVSGLGAAEKEQSKRVFWLAYMYDKDISLRTACPPAQDDNDMDIELPTETIHLDSERLSGLNFYNYHIGLSIIQGQIYQRLFSIRAKKRSVFDRVISANELVVMLEAWKGSLPIACLNHESPDALDFSNFFTFLHTVILKFTYFHALCTVCNSIPADHRTAELNILCVNEARESLQLCPALPQGDFACVWLLLDFVFSASSTILSHIISQPHDLSAEVDLGLVDPVLDLLVSLNKTDRDGSGVAGMEISLAAMKTQAMVAIEGGKEQSSGKHSGKKIVTAEDFVQRLEMLSAEKCKEFRAASKY